MQSALPSPAASSPRKKLAAMAMMAGAMWLMPAQAQRVEDYELAPVNYSASQPQDLIAHLEQRLLRGELQLQGDGRSVLQTLLQELQIPVASQMLVFSRTSLQRERISPATPRTIYFSDNVYLGWVPGGLIEIASMDEQLGPVFYALDPRGRPLPGKPRFARPGDCLRCHGGNFVRGIPGLFAPSVFPDSRGEPLFRHGGELVDHRTPFALRWGGWYVTGTHGTTLHRGNVVAGEAGGKLVVDHARGANITDLAKSISVDAYPAKTSDVVALMVFEHQMAVHNALTRAGFETRRMLAYQQNLQRELGKAVTDEPAYDSVRRVIETQVQEVLDQLLFKDEASLPAGGIQGSAAFQQEFLRSARRTRAGVSLKDLDLTTRLFRHRCSYVIHTRSFQALPPVLKAGIIERLAQVLRPGAADARYAYLEAAEKKQIAAILVETDAGFAAQWERGK